MDELILLELEAIAQHQMRQARVFRDRYNPVEFLSDREFIELYRLRKCDVMQLLENGFGSIRETRRSQSIPAITQICAVLNILGTGATYRKTAELMGISPRSVLYCFWPIIDQFLNRAPEFIKFPENTIQISQQFYDLGQIPNVIGCVDGTLIRIKRPSENEHVYICRKGFPALNALIENQPNLTISYLNCKFPGASHDAFIYRMSDVYDALHRGKLEGEGILLGDSAFPLNHFTLTPILYPTTNEERSYNREFRKVRCSVERTIGVWKCRWRIIDTQGGPIRCQPNKAAKIIVACAVLHNMCISNGVPAPAQPMLIERDRENEIAEEAIEGAELRGNIIESFRVRQGVD